MEVVWGNAAQREFESAIAYIRLHSSPGAERVGKRILDAISLLATFPQLAPPSTHRGLRQLVVARTPYLVIYRIHENRIEIRAVIHAKQKRRK